MQAIESMKSALELARASGSSAVPMNPEIVSEVIAHIGTLTAENERLNADRRDLQAFGTHPAPCARHCEANAFFIKIMELEAEIRAADLAIAEYRQQCLDNAAEIARLRAESEERLQNCAALIAENEQLRKDAERYRWLAAHARNTSEHWGGRWSLVIDGPAPKSHNSEDDLDDAIDAAMKGTP